ncbi:phage tail tape measure protein, TP901 family [Mycobacterium xenopi 3993]|nr:phage tail tape measure protein, TP901 family [Mycobacterium xenopi 3993]
MPMAAIQTAASGLNMLAPGAGIAAQIGIQEINRAIAYAGQVAGIGVQGLMETFLPTAGSQLAQNNWITRIVGGIAGARPSCPTLPASPACQATRPAAGAAAAAAKPGRRAATPGQR